MSLPDSVNAPLVIQLTDSHLFARANGRLLGIDTAASLQQVVAQVVREQPRIDLLLASGDLSQDGSVASYQRFCELTEPLAAPMRWLAGNHDENAPMAKACGDRDFLERSPTWAPGASSCSTAPCAVACSANWSRRSWSPWTRP